tara:strand:- start:1050 stop:1247 length:198 start_codon:yes stop_codon:yes gene_type:complete
MVSKKQHIHWRQKRENKLALEYFKSLPYDEQQKIRKAVIDNSDNPNETPAQKGLRKAVREVLSDA